MCQHIHVYSQFMRLQNIDLIFFHFLCEDCFDFFARCDTSNCKKIQKIENWFYYSRKHLVHIHINRLLLRHLFRQQPSQWEFPSLIRSHEMIPISQWQLFRKPDASLQELWQSSKHNQRCQFRAQPLCVDNHPFPANMQASPISDVQVVLHLECFLR